MGAKQRQPNQHTRTRLDHATEVAEDYVEAIAAQVDREGVCRAVDLAKQFQVSHVTVNRTIARLQRDGFVSTVPYGPIELTSHGERLARSAKERHDIVLRFLLALGIDRKIAEVDSEGIEHHVSPETLRAMKRYVAEQIKGVRPL